MISLSDYETPFTSQIEELLLNDNWITAAEIASKLKITESTKSEKKGNATSIYTFTGPEKVLCVMGDLRKNYQIDRIRYDANGRLFSEFNKFGNNFKNIHGLYQFHIRSAKRLNKYYDENPNVYDPDRYQCNLAYFDKLYPHFTEQEKELCHHICILKLPYSEREAAAKSGINFYEKYAAESRQKLKSLNMDESK